MSEKKSTEDPKKITPPKWSSPEDPRKNAKAGKYPNYFCHKTRSGHTFMMDDSNEAEHIVLQHRSGACVQFMPDGCVQFISHNGHYDVVFGENRMLVTGAYDVIVQGGASLKVDGNYNVTVKGDTNLDVNGDFNVTAKNMNQTIRGNIDVQAKNKTEKIEGSSTSQAQGAMTLVSDAGMTIGSSSDSVAIGAAKQLGLMAKGGSVSVKAGGKTSFRSGGDFAVDAPRVFSNSGVSEDVESVFSQTAAKVPSKESDTPVDV